MDSIVENLAFYRKLVLGLTQKQLAEQIGYSTRTISRAENGKIRPSVAYLIAFSLFAHVSLDTLCGLEPTKILVDGLTKEQIELFKKQVEDMQRAAEQ